MPPFFCAIFGACTKRQAIRVWPHSEIFAGRRARKNACWGAPQTRWTSGQIVPKSRRKRLLDAARANAPGPYFPARPYGRADNQCLP